MSKTIKKRQVDQKEELLKRLSEVPIVEIACKRVGISRSTFYRWKKEDSEFLIKIDSELQKGVLLINDMAESQLLSKIKEGNITALIFWLKHRHKDYSQRMEITATTNGLSLEEIDKLSNLLFNEKTFNEGQKKLLSLVSSGKISEKFAHFILKAFLTKIKAEDVFSRKIETEILSRVLTKRK